ncbi:MAG: hypothetical protein AB1772_12805 [Candidatus Zixiibacteriota bacterium]
MKRFIAVTAVLLLLAPMVYSQGGWDVDKGDPPPMGSERQPNAKPQKIEQFAFLFYEVSSCQELCKLVSQAACFSI